MPPSVQHYIVFWRICIVGPIVLLWSPFDISPCRLYRLDILWAVCDKKGTTTTLKSRTLLSETLTLCRLPDLPLSITSAIAYSALIFVCMFGWLLTKQCNSGPKILCILFQITRDTTCIDIFCFAVGTVIASEERAVLFGRDVFEQYDICGKGTPVLDELAVDLLLACRYAYDVRTVVIL